MLVTSASVAASPFLASGHPGRGDAYLFSSRLPHRFHNAGDDEAIVIGANTPPL